MAKITANRGEAATFKILQIPILFDDTSFCEYICYITVWNIFKTPIYTPIVITNITKDLDLNDLLKDCQNFSL